MEAENVVWLLESNWEGLRKSTGHGWPAFVAAYAEIVAGLNSESRREEFEEAIDRLCELLERYEYGVMLLRDSKRKLKYRLIEPPYKTLKDQEPLNLVCNRLLGLLEKENKQSAPIETPQPDKSND